MEQEVDRRQEEHLPPCLLAFHEIFRVRLMGSPSSPTPAVTFKAAVFSVNAPRPQQQQEATSALRIRQACRGGPKGP